MSDRIANKNTTPQKKEVMVGNEEEENLMKKAVGYGQTFGSQEPLSTHPCQTPINLSLCLDQACSYIASPLCMPLMFWLHTN